MKIKLNHRCRNCNSNKIHKLIDFNKVPLANNLQKNLTKIAIKFELQLVLCLDCWLVQTTKNIKREKIFNSEYKLMLNASLNKTCLVKKDESYAKDLIFNIN